ncbi:hypothetical protein, partial [Pantoea stewartii]|uniref:hypothetical protein n=1 Tax=Pantoea stewartii TaxID=66269 RepID=UPI0025A175F8
RVTDSEQARAEFEPSSCAGCREDERDRGNDRSGNGPMTVCRCNKPDVMGLSAEIFPESWVTFIRF